MKKAARAILVIIGLLLVFVVWTLVRPELWWRFNHQVPDEIEAILKSSDSPEELRKRQRVALVVEFGPSDWLAIGYRDTHAAGPYTCCIARCSDGDWFETQRHFCGQFGTAKRDYEWVVSPDDFYPDLSEEVRKEILEEARTSLEANPIGLLLGAVSLEEAKEHLVQIGFFSRN